MNISIFGLGYVGCVSLGCLAETGHNVIGVDINGEKVELINQGKPTIIEDKIEEIMSEQHKAGRIRATTSHQDAVSNSEVSIICVGTPSSENGQLNLENLFDVAKQIGIFLAEKAVFHTVVIRSTVLPGTNNKVGQVIEKASGKKRNVDFGVVSNPEFMREGSAVEDFYHPFATVVGSDCRQSIEVVRKMYKEIDAPVEETGIEVAEIIKYVNNSFHALKITFANEVGNICKKIKVDAYKVMDIFCKDDKLNISTSYFKPGFAYGGSCLPKDLKALKTIAHDNYLEVPVIQSIEKSNELQKEIAFKMIASKGKKNVGVVGLSFKTGTDDLRYSPTVDLVEKLIGKGYRVKIYDRDVYISKLTGTNKQYIDAHIPHLSDLITYNLQAIVEQSDILVVSHNYEKLAEVLKKHTDIEIIDFVRIFDDISQKKYEGICW